MGTDLTKYRVHKTFVSRTTPNNAIERLTDAALSKKGGFICVSNMRMVVYACKTPEYEQYMMKSLMNWPDGKPLSWCGRVWGLRDVKCTRGPDIFIRVLQSGDKRLKHFLVGDTQDVLEEIVQKYGKTSNIVGLYSPPFCEVENYDYNSITVSIRQSGANVVWTALTAPKQDIFNAKLSQIMPDVVFVGVGRAFRMSVGKIKDAPSWAQKMGVGGVFIGRSKWHLRLSFYIKRSFGLVWYIIEIIVRRIFGKKYYE